MIDVPKEIFGILGLGVVGFVGEEVLAALGQRHYGIAFKILLMGAATWVGLKDWTVYLGKIESVMAGWRF